MTPQQGPADPSPDAGGDGTVASLAILGFSVSLGVGQLALPLLALASGYDAAAVGVLAAISAIAQVGFRLSLPWLLRRYPDRSLMLVACLMIVSSYGALLVSTAFLVFVAAQLLLGSSRALFWTSSQTHAVRGDRGSVGSLARVQLVGNFGTLIGPLLAGIISSTSLQLALVLGAGTGLFGAAFSMATRYLPPFVRDPETAGHGRVWRRPGVDVGCWASYTAGGWRALLGSYFPVVLTEAGLGPSAVGAFMALADGASFGSAALLARWTPTAVRPVVSASTIATGVAVVGMPFVAWAPILAAGLMIVGGLGAGLLLTMGPAIASDGVSAQERGEAIAAAGTFRAIAIFATPAAVAASLSVVALPVGIVVAGVLLAVPTLASAFRAPGAEPVAG